MLNYEDEVLRPFGETLKAKVIFFSSARRLEEGVFLEDGKIVLKLNGEAEEVLCTIDELQLLGTHNYENVMAAAAMCKSLRSSDRGDPKGC